MSYSPRRRSHRDTAPPTGSYGIPTTKPLFLTVPIRGTAAGVAIAYGHLGGLRQRCQRWVGVDPQPLKDRTMTLADILPSLRTSLPVHLTPGVWPVTARW